MRNLALKHVALAAALALSPAAAMAQDNSTGTTGATTDDTTYAQPQREDDKDFPWGLLGLLGLAGLAGLKRKERDIHVDARRNNP
jgi:MYXO-CTERM domain-containing protein